MKYLLPALLATLAHFASGQSGKTYLFVGTYTNGKPDKGIYIYTLDSATGALKKVAHGNQITNPSYLCISPDGNYVYACTDTKLPHAGSVSAFRFDSASGAISFINKQNSGGENPVYVSTGENNKFIINTNYTEGTVSVFTTNANGSVNPYTQLIAFHGSSINTRRQDKSHVHAAVFAPDFKYIIFPDLGADKIRVFQWDTAALQPLIPIENFDVSAVPGSGPRHFVFHPNRHFAYCIEELSGTVAAFRYDNGKLDSIQRIFSYSKWQEEYNSADLHISPDGLFLYASNRWDQENTIAIFAIDTLTGRLQLVGHQPTFGDGPRNFALDPGGRFLIVANQFSNNLVVFQRNANTGLLRRTGKEVKVPGPSCLQIRKYEVK